MPSQALMNDCMEEVVKKKDTALCTSDQSAYYHSVCWFQVSIYEFNIVWMIALTVLITLFTVYQIYKAFKTKERCSWINFNQSIFYSLLPDYNIFWRFLLFLTISLGYFYWIPLENVIQSKLFATIHDSNSPDPLTIYLVQLVGTITEFFYFWITFFVTLMLGTRWEYTVLNLSEHVSKEDMILMLKYMIKKSLIFSSVFTVIRVALALTYSKELNYTYNYVIVNEFSFRVYRFLRAIFILTYAYQRYINYSGRFSKLISGKRNEITEMEVKYRLKKHEKDILSSEQKLFSVIKHTKGYDVKQKDEFLGNVRVNLKNYFEMHKQELKNSIGTIIKQDAITIPRNPKETPLIGGIYLVFMIISNALFALFALANEMCNLFATDRCNCRSVKFSLDLVMFSTLIFDQLFISFIIQFLLRVGGVFEVVIELNADDDEEN